MLNHKFYFEGATKDDKEKYVRVSHELIEKMKPDLREFKFTWQECDEPRYGFSAYVKVLNAEELEQIKKCLLKQPKNEWEFEKFMRFIDKALAEGKDVIHDYFNWSGRRHEFVVCDEFPTEKIMDYNYYRYNYDFVLINDQYISENYGVFKNVKLYWNDTETKDDGFNYYGRTLISTRMAQELLDAMAEYLKDNTSEEAVYFKGKDYDVLVGILEEAIMKNKVVIHFGG